MSVDGLFGQAVVPAIVLRIAGLVRAGCPLQEVLVGDAGYGQQQGEGVESPQALCLDHLHEFVAREAWGDAALQPEDHTEDQCHQHHNARLLVPPEHLLLGLAFRVGCSLGGAHSPKDANGHDEVQMPQCPAVGELRQGLAVLEGLEKVPGQGSNRDVRDLVLQVAANLRRLLADHLLHCSRLRPVRVLCRHQLAHQHVAVSLHPSLLRMLEDLEILCAICACLGHQDVVATGVAAQQRLEVVDTVVDDHIRLLRGVVLGHLCTGEERQVLTGGDLRQLREAALLRQRRSIRLARHLDGRLHCLDLLLGRALEATQLIVQLPQLHDDGVHRFLWADLAGLELRAHVVLHPLLAGEPARDLVEHGRRIPAGPCQDGVALLLVVLQEVRQVVDLATDGDPAVVRLVVPGHLRQGDVTARPAHGYIVLVRVVLVRQELLHGPLHLRRLREILGIQGSPLLRLEALELLLQLRVDVLVLQKPRDAVGFVGFGALAQQAVDLLADLHDPGLAQRVPEVVGHQVLVNSQVAQECLEECYRIRY